VREGAEPLFQKLTGHRHGVGAVRYDNGRFDDLRANHGEDQVAVFVGHQQAVLVHQRCDFDAGSGQAKRLEITVDFLSRVLHLTRTLRIHLFDGAARGDNVNLHLATYLFCLAGFALPLAGQAPDPVEIMKRSVSADQRNEEIRQAYTYDLFNETRELDAAGKVKSTKSTKVEVVTVAGRRLRLLTERNGKPLPAVEARKEQEKYERAAQEAAKLTPAERQKRIADEKRRNDEEREKFKRIPEAFRFTLMGESVINGRPAWQIHAAPLKTYKGPYAFLLRNMEGTLWIDKADYAWVRVEAETLDTVSFGWFFARIAKGTRLNFESEKVNGEIWAPTRIHFRATARLALLISTRIDQDVVFSRYRRFQTDSRVVAIDDDEK
jgi:hypothetical protein